ncbi:MAG: AAA family ATPase, partial [Candidatus Competibacteraceae bacterium]|nr:AAA family ATPase [Candidatus Competibacteraceae bacterium]
MSKARTIYVCAECGAQASKWSGQCGDCGAWNTLQETVATPPTKAGMKPVGYAGATAGEVRNLAEVDAAAEIRQSCGNGELDRVLGGGLVQGSVTLIGGDPGIGKSTLLLQVQAVLAQRDRTLYVSGEESPQQISLRAQRLQLSRDRLRLLPEINVERILATAEIEQPRVMVIDSIQTVYTERLQS